jgi:hypothetical protein
MIRKLEMIGEATKRIPFAMGVKYGLERRTIKDVLPQTRAAIRQIG